MTGRTRLHVLYLCTGNSCRSQMAEGWTRHLKEDRVSACSAGTQPKSVDPRAVRVMAEAGVDISGGRSKAPHDLDLASLDFVVTVCGHADETCPDLPLGVTKVHVGFDDPPLLARDAQDEEEALAAYRRVRDEIRAFVEGLPESLAES
jgi:arsenate reductase